VFDFACCRKSKRRQAAQRCLFEFPLEFDKPEGRGNRAKGLGSDKLVAGIVC